MIRTLRIDAPAKINLGLEILGQRDDGFHEIRSILAMVELHDTLEFRLDEQSTGTIHFEPDSVNIDPIDNLISGAIAAFNQFAETAVTPDITVRKRIPVASGLGGASSDCAATLIAMNHLADNPLNFDQLSQIAAGLGSDIPFFLGSPTALVSGRGTEIRPISNPKGYVVLVSPVSSIRDKTRTIYHALREQDFSDGSRVERQVAKLQVSGELDQTLLGNAFTIALSAVLPESDVIVLSATAAGVTPIFLSGAGPTHYALLDTFEESQRAVEKLAGSLAGRADIITTTFRRQGIVA